MRKRKLRIIPGQVIEFPVTEHLRAYARVYHELLYGIYRFVASERPSDLSVILGTGICAHLSVAEYESEKGNWPIIGKHPFSESDPPTRPPFRFESWQFPDKITIKVNENGVVRDATPADANLPLSKVLDEVTLVEETRELLRGTPIWPTGEPFDPDKHPAPKFVEEHSDDPNSFKTLDEVKVPLSLTSLRDDIAMPCVRAVKKVVSSLKKLGDDATTSEKLAIFQACVEKINQIEEKHGGIDTSDRETMLDLLYAIGDLVGLSSADKYLDEWRNW